MFGPSAEPSALPVSSHITFTTERLRLIAPLVALGSLTMFATLSTTRAYSSGVLLLGRP